MKAIAACMLAGQPSLSAFLCSVLILFQDGHIPVGIAWCCVEIYFLACCDAPLLFRLLMVI